MAFSEEIVREAWKRSGGRCEKCGSSLLWTLRGATSTAGGWSAVRRTSWGTDVLLNCEIRCAGCQRPRAAPNS